jgi:hypothetical protein
MDRPRIPKTTNRTEARSKAIAHVGASVVVVGAPVAVASAVVRHLARQREGPLLLGLGIQCKIVSESLGHSQIAITLGGAVILASRVELPTRLVVRGTTTSPPPSGERHR